MNATSKYFVEQIMAEVQRLEMIDSTVQYIAILQEVQRQIEERIKNAAVLL